MTKQRFASLLFIIGACLALRAQGLYDPERKPRFAVRNNAIYDAALTPNLSVELELRPHWSFVGEGVWAWWSRDARHRYWRIYGGSIEVRRWLGSKSDTRMFAGHHLGVYASCHSYDFEFGHKGWQSPLTFGAGVGYGYSVKLGARVNLDFGLRVGYHGGWQKEYIPQCGTYVATRRGCRHYFGLTGLEVSVVWFPGRGSQNNPDFSL